MTRSCAWSKSSMGQVLALAARAADRRLVAEVREIGAGQPARARGDGGKVDVRAERLAARVDAEDPLATLDVGRGDEDLAVEATGPQERRIELLEQVGGRHHDDVAGRVETVHLDEQLVERLLALAGVVRAAHAADGVELVDEDDRGRMLARLAKQAPDAGRAEAGEHLDERRRRLREELRAGFVRDGLGQQRLARAGRAVQQHAGRDARAEVAEALGVTQEVDDLAQLVLGLVDAGDVVPADRGLHLGLDLHRLRARHHLQRSPEEEGDDEHEDDHEYARPVRPEVLDAVEEALVHPPCYRQGARGTSVRLDGHCAARARRAGSRRARRVRPRAGARSARACRAGAAARSRACAARARRRCRHGARTRRRPRRRGRARSRRRRTARPRWGARACGAAAPRPRCSTTAAGPSGASRSDRAPWRRRWRPPRRSRRRRSPCARRRGRRRARRRAARRGSAAARRSSRRPRRRARPSGGCAGCGHRSPRRTSPRAPSRPETAAAPRAARA